MSIITPMDIVSVDQSPDAGNADNNVYLKKVREKVDGELTHESVKDLVDGVLKKIGKNGCIRKLTIIGHGTAGTLVVGGRRFTGIKGKEINGKKEDWEKELKRLKGKFCPTGGKLVLAGCSVGVCEKGAKKLQQVADVVGVPVCAPGRDLNVFNGDFDSDGLSDKAEKDLVEVKPGQNVSTCLVKEDGTRVKKLKKLKDASAGSARVQRLGVPLLGARPGRSFIHPIGDASVIDALLSQIDFSVAYDGSQLGAIVEGQLSVLGPEGVVDQWNIILDFQGVETARNGLAVVYEVKDPTQFRALHELLAGVQLATDALYAKALGLSVQRTPPPLQLAKELRPDVAPRIDRDFRELSGRELLRSPVAVIRGIGAQRAKFLAELGVETVADLAALEFETPFSEAARMVRDLAELEGG